jgi:hypothetical protein
LQIEVSDEVFSIDCYNISLGSRGMVLGVHWLESLGSILWDFSHCTIDFVRDEMALERAENRGPTDDSARHIAGPHGGVAASI